MLLAKSAGLISNKGNTLLSDRSTKAKYPDKSEDCIQSEDLIHPEDLIQRWVEQCVIDLSLCPFASAPYRSGKVRIAVCDAETISGFLATIQAELKRLTDNPDTIETTLIATQRLLPDFLDFNDFLTSVEAILKQENSEMYFQMASFHPQYRFAGVDEDDAGNFTNRAPYPIVQWLRAASVSKATDAMDTLAIPDANIKKLNSLGSSKLRALFPWTE